MPETIPGQTCQEILLVDDDRNLLDSVVRGLGRRYSITSVDGAEKALALLKSGREFAVLVSDLAMPGINGIELLERARGLAPDTVRIMLTGHSDRESLISSINNGYLFRFLEKPVSNQQLAIALDDGLRQYARVVAEKELFALRRRQMSLTGVVAAFVKLMEARDPYTAGHQEQVALLAGAMAREMGLAGQLVAAVATAATIHDIGKMYVPAEFLNRPGTLSAVEFRVVKEHPAVGYAVLKEVEFDLPVAQFVHQHHERLNGKGYPQGLAGEAIHLEARIIAVADVVEAMASHRPYRPALGARNALEEIKRGQGVIYDPAAVEACIKVVERGEWRIPEPASQAGAGHGAKAARLDSV